MRGRSRHRASRRSPSRRRDACRARRRPRRRSSSRGPVAFAAFSFRYVALRSAASTSFWSFVFASAFDLRGLLVGLLLRGGGLVVGLLGGLRGLCGLRVGLLLRFFRLVPASDGADCESKRHEHSDAHVDSHVRFSLSGATSTIARRQAVAVAVRDVRPLDARAVRRLHLDGPRVVVRNARRHEVAPVLVSARLVLLALRSRSAARRTNRSRRAGTTPPRPSPPLPRLTRMRRAPSRRSRPAR